MEDEVYEEEQLTEPGFEEEPLDGLEASHEAGTIDSVELGFSKGYEEDKEQDVRPLVRRRISDRGSEEMSVENDKDLDAVDPLGPGDLDI